MPVTGVEPYAALEAALRAHIVGRPMGDPDRDIDGMSTQQDATGCLYVGTWQDHPRLKLGVAIDATRVADVLLVATKGAVRADNSIVGKQGPNIGNSLLVGRLLHVAVFALRASGIAAVRNVPYDARVRRLYVDMGFDNGERLLLDHVPSLTKMFEYVEQTYHHSAAGGRFSLATPPLPL